MIYTKVKEKINIRAISDEGKSKVNFRSWYVIILFFKDYDNKKENTISKIGCNFNRKSTYKLSNDQHWKKKNIFLKILLR